MRLTGIDLEEPMTATTARALFGDAIEAQAPASSDRCSRRS
jgi:hypothetical protein